MDNQSGHILTLANSIIGVSILAMPYCFKQCGIVLSVLMLIMSSIISRLACHFLLKSAIIARRKTFEFLAFHIFGSMGKLAIEIGIIGFLLGTCIAFFVVMGDLGPEIIAEMTGIYTTNTMRTSILMALALFCVLPLGLLRNVDSLNGVSKATIGFYCCLVLKIIFEAVPHIFSGDWYGNVAFWRPSGILQCLPIFSMALFCQTQLFEIYQALPNATLDKMNDVVRIAVNICTWVYLFVGIFGYIAFSHKQFTGNILLSFSPSLMTDVMKIGFVLSVAFSFPLVIFPCRASLYSLLYKEGYSIHEGMSNYIPEGKFKGLTMFIVFISLIIGIMIPNIELVLGLVGSTIGVMICVLFPVTCFICISPRNTNERILAQIMLMIGVFVMVLGTYKNLHTIDNHLEPNTVTISSIKNLDQLDLNAVNKVDVPKDIIEKISTVKTVNVEIKVEQVKIDLTTLGIVEELKEVRHEPPQPIEPQEEVEIEKKIDVKDESAIKVTAAAPVENNDKESDAMKPVDAANEPKIDHKNDEVDVEAIKKEDREVELQEKEKIKSDDSNHQVLIDTIQQQNKMQKEIVEQQKKLIEVIKSQQKNAEASDIHKVHEEKVKAMKQIESIALQAIEKIGGGKEGEKLAADLEKHIEAKVEETVNQKTVLNEAKEGDEPVKTVNKIEEKDPESNNVDKSQEIVILAKDNDSLVLEQKKNVPDSNYKIEKTAENKNQIPEVQIGRNNQINKKRENTLNASLNPSQENDKKENIQAGSINIDTSNKIEIPAQEKNVPPLSNITNTNNTAPLFLKLGKAEQKQESDLNKMPPIPIVVSNNLIKDSNSSKVEPVFDLKKMVEPRKEKELAVSKDNIESQAMRRDILMLKTRKK